MLPQQCPESPVPNDICMPSLAAPCAHQSSWVLTGNLLKSLYCKRNRRLSFKSTPFVIDSPDRQRRPRHPSQCNTDYRPFVHVRRPSNLLVSWPVHFLSPLLLTVVAGRHRRHPCGTTVRYRPLAPGPDLHRCRYHRCLGARPSANPGTLLCTRSMTVARSPGSPQRSRDLISWWVYGGRCGRD